MKIEFKRLFVWLAIICFVLAVLPLGGCSKAVPLNMKTTTTKKLNGDVVTVEEQGAPPAVSQAASDMGKACYESFKDEDRIPDSYLAKMDSEDIKDILQMKLLRDGLMKAYGYNPREVCKTPKNIYDYAIVHDRELYKTIRGGYGMIERVAPWVASAVLGVNGQNQAGPEVKGDFVPGEKSTDQSSTITEFAPPLVE